MELSEITVSYKSPTTQKIKLRSSRDARDIIFNSWNQDTLELQEEFKILMLNRANQLLGVYPLSRGGIAGTVVDVRLIFSTAIKCNACSIILTHNHPSGNTNPSQIDIKLTKKILKAGALLDIEVLDHIIITRNDYFSFKDSALM